MTSSMETPSNDNLSQWIDILAGKICPVEPLEPQPYAVGIFTGCNTAMLMECDAPMESVASSPECIARDCAVDAAWQPSGCGYGCGSSTFPRDELDELLEELANDTSCPYLQQLTVPNLMAVFQSAGIPGAVKVAPPPQHHHHWLPGGALTGLESLLPCPEAAALPGVLLNRATSSSMLLNYSTAAAAPLPGKATPPTEHGPAASHACSQLEAVLAALNGSGCGGAWGDGGDSQLYADTASILQSRTSATGAIMNRSGGGGSCPAVVSYSCTPRCVDGCVQGLMVPSVARIDKTGLADQPPIKVRGAQDIRELWLSKSLRRLRSIVKMRSSGGNQTIKPAGAVTDASPGAAAAGVMTCTGVPGSCTPGGGGAAPGINVDDAGSASDQMGCSRRYSVDAGSAGRAATDARRSPVLLLAARLRGISHKHKPQ